MRRNLSLHLVRGNSPHERNSTILANRTETQLKWFVQRWKEESEQQTLFVINKFFFLDGS